MADPGNPSEFSPAELDRLEDALEQWTGDAFDHPVPEDSSLPAPLRARLADYRDVLALSREALALEDVPEDLLTSVLAEAHASAASAPLTTPRPDPTRPGLWARLRRSLLLPGVALAGSTVMLLWQVQPPDQADELVAERGAPGGTQAPTDVAPAPARLAPGDGPAPAGPSPAEAAPAPAPPPSSDAPGRVDEALKLDARAAADASPAATAPDVDHKAAGSKAELKAPSKRHSKEEAADLEIEVLPGLDDAPTQDADKEALRDTLEQADSHRRGGRCEAAMALYEQAFTMSGPADERARARAGYGLCVFSQGDDGKADKYFEYATRLSPGVAGWIARERGEGAYSKKSKVSKPSPAKSKLPTAEPFK